MKKPRGIRDGALGMHRGDTRGPSEPRVAPRPYSELTMTTPPQDAPALTPARNGAGWVGGTLIFIAELAMLVAIAYWAFHAFDGVVQWVVGLGVPLAVAVLWGYVFSPKASVSMPKAAKLTGRTAILLLGPVALWAADQTELAIALAAVIVVGTVLTWGWEPGGTAPASSSHDAGLL